MRGERTGRRPAITSLDPLHGYLDPCLERKEQIYELFTNISRDLVRSSSFVQISILLQRSGGKLRGGKGGRKPV